MKCPNCASEVPETANVCGYCGNQLRSAAPPPQPEVRQTQPASGGIPGWAWGLGGFVLIGGILLVAGIVLMNSSGLFAPAPNNPSNQPVEPVAPIQVEITATPQASPQWVEVYRDDFSDPQKSIIPTDEFGGRTIIDGEYHLAMDGGGYIPETFYEVNGDFKISFDVYYVSAEDGVYSSWEFDIFSIPPGENDRFTSWESIVITHTGLISVYGTDNEFNGYSVIEEFQSPHIKQGVEVVNHIEIQGIDSKILVYINGNEVVVFDHPTPELDHSLGVTVNNLTTVSFDNIVVEEYRMP